MDQRSRAELEAVRVAQSEPHGRGASPSAELHRRRLAGGDNDNHGLDAAGEWFAAGVAKLHDRPLTVG